MPIYVMTHKPIGDRARQFRIRYHDDRTARMVAAQSETCTCVETETGRNVWRRPLSAKEFDDAMKRR